MTRLDHRSDSQANAEALDRRSRTYADPHYQSVTIQWDWSKRQPRSLRDAADMLRRAYADEVPTKLHNSDLADDGTPKMTPQAESFIFGDPRAGDTPFEPDGSRPILDYYRTPVRAAIAKLRTDSPPRAAIIQHVACGAMKPIQATIEAGIDPWAAHIVARDVVFAFLAQLSDLKIALPKVDNAA